MHPEQGRILKKLSKFCQVFFRSTKLIFKALAKAIKNLVLAKISVPQAKF